jgi:hypothetical protein
MSNRNNIQLPYKLVNAGDMSANITSGVTDITYRSSVGIQLNFTGTPTGTFGVEASVDGVTFEPLTFSSSITAAGAAGRHLIALENVPFSKVRITYTASSGSGALDAFIMAKGV